MSISIIIESPTVNMVNGNKSLENLCMWSVRQLAAKHFFRRGLTCNRVGESGQEFALAEVNVL